VTISPWRGHDISRLEGFSDAVFGFALTLLVVTLEVPETFDELMVVMRGFVAFALSFAVVAWIWYEHNIFFRTYGLQDGHTIFLNSLLLFVVLFYVFPLRFAFSAMVSVAANAGRPETASGSLMIAFEELPMLFRIYGTGFVVLFFIFALLYQHAWRSRERLGLSADQADDARDGVRTHLVSVAVGLASVASTFVLPVQYGYGAGFVYFLMGPAHALNGRRIERRRARAAVSHAAKR
jgi:uncharacterized membrane protein